VAIRQLPLYRRRILKAIEERGPLTLDEASKATQVTRIAREVISELRNSGELIVNGDMVTAGDVATRAVATGEPKIEFERMLRTDSLLNGLCPFRGGNWCRLDERCPATVEVVMAGILDSNREDALAPVPVLRHGTYCRSCVDDGTREKEIGKDALKQTGYVPPKGRGLSRSRRGRR
jgi:hypothetical protein